jgi:hypothetical protein
LDLHWIGVQGWEVAAADQTQNACDVAFVQALVQGVVAAAHEMVEGGEVEASV